MRPTSPVIDAARIVLARLVNALVVVGVVQIVNNVFGQLVVAWVHTEQVIDKHPNSRNDILCSQRVQGSGDNACVGHNLITELPAER